MHVCCPGPYCLIDKYLENLRTIPASCQALFVRNMAPHIRRIEEEKTKQLTLARASDTSFKSFPCSANSLSALTFALVVLFAPSYPLCDLPSLKSVYYYLIPNVNNNVLKIRSSTYQAEIFACSGSGSYCSLNDWKKRHLEGTSFTSKSTVFFSGKSLEFSSRSLLLASLAWLRASASGDGVWPVVGSLPGHKIRRGEDLSCTDLKIAFVRYN